MDHYPSIYHVIWRVRINQDAFKHDGRFTGAFELQSQRHHRPALLHFVSSPDRNSSCGLPLLIATATVSMCMSGPFVPLAQTAPAFEP